MRHRKTAGGSKIKMEHAMIHGLRDLLESIARFEEIQSIIPARIQPTKCSQGSLRLDIQYPTVTGLKCKAYAGGSVQEVFIVTDKPREVEEKLRHLKQ
jgi:hypothetical protein